MFLTTEIIYSADEDKEIFISSAVNEHIVESYRTRCLDCCTSD